MKEARWIRFVERRYSIRRSAKTRVWLVLAVRDGLLVGEVRWYSHWRRYCFIAGAATIPFALARFIFDAECLRELADFAEARTREHNAARAAAKAG